MIKFLNNEHKERFNKCIEQDGTYEYDFERKSLFYILSGNDDLYRRIEDIYDFDDRSINLDVILNKSHELSSAARKMLSLGLNLYNNFKYKDFNSSDYSTLELFAGLDEFNFELCIRALRIRFDMSGKGVED